jgi:hypothetical protein
MALFTKPEALNGTQLRDELRTAGVTISDDINAVLDTSDGSIYLDIKKADESKAATVVAAHVGVDLIIELSIEDKLASVGISLDDLKAALSA